MQCSPAMGSERPRLAIQAEDKKPALLISAEFLSVVFCPLEHDVSLNMIKMR